MGVVSSAGGKLQNLGGAGAPGRCRQESRHSCCWRSAGQCPDFLVDGVEGPAPHRASPESAQGHPDEADPAFVRSVHAAASDPDVLKDPLPTTLCGVRTDLLVHTHYRAGPTHWYIRTTGPVTGSRGTRQSLRIVDAVNARGPFGTGSGPADQRPRRPFALRTLMLWLYFQLPSAPDSGNCRGKVNVPSYAAASNVAHRSTNASRSVASSGLNGTAT